jgi:heme-degrading monooxygenase HmoA
MIARTWRGWTAAANADIYHRYLLDTGVREYRETPGNLGVHVLRRIEGERAEFLLVTFWESMDGVRAFAGEEPEQAVFYPEDRRYLVAYETEVTHYEVMTP